MASVGRKGTALWLALRRLSPYHEKVAKAIMRFHVFVARGAIWKFRGFVDVAAKDVRPMVRPADRSTVGDRFLSDLHLAIKVLPHVDVRRVYPVR